MSPLVASTGTGMSTEDRAPTRGEVTGGVRKFASNNKVSKNLIAQVYRQKNLFGLD